MSSSSAAAIASLPEGVAVAKEISSTTKKQFPNTSVKNARVQIGTWIVSNDIVLRELKLQYGARKFVYEFGGQTADKLRAVVFASLLGAGSGGGGMEQLVDNVAAAANASFDSQQGGRIEIPFDNVSGISWNINTGRLVLQLTTSPSLFTRRGTKGKYTPVVSSTKDFTKGQASRPGSTVTFILPTEGVGSAAKKYIQERLFVSEPRLGALSRDEGTAAAAGLKRAPSTGASDPIPPASKKEKLADVTNKQQTTATLKASSVATATTADTVATATVHKKHRAMTVKAVNTLLQTAGVANPESVSHCLRAGIQKRHITLDDNKGLDTIVTTGSCLSCSADLSVTVRDLLYQPDYAGMDYEDGGENASVKCNECGTGVYISSMCTGQLDFDSGKSHNHCTRCKGFGKCIGDYREAHCDGCGKHYFAGSMGSYGCENPRCSRSRRGGGGGVSGNKECSVM